MCYLEYLLVHLPRTLQQILKRHLHPIMGQRLGCPHRFLQLNGQQYPLWAHQFQSPPPHSVLPLADLHIYVSASFDLVVPAAVMILEDSSRCSPVFSCDQAALWMVFSVCPSVCLSVSLSVRRTFLTMFPHHHIIMKFQELSPRTRVTSMQKVEVRGQRSRSQRSQPNLAVSGL